MNIFSKKLVRCEELEKRIKLACSFNNAKCEFVQGRILSIDKTNVCFIEPHRVNIKIKDKKVLLIYFDENNVFLYDRTMQITIQQLTMLLQCLRED